MLPAASLQYGAELNLVIIISNKLHIVASHVLPGPSGSDGRWGSGSDTHE